jgi:hypothetical protein
MLLQQQSVWSLQLTEPTDLQLNGQLVSFDVWWQQFIQPGVRACVPYPVSWLTLKGIQEWDQLHYGGTVLHRLTPRHFARTAFDRMNVGLALDIMREDTARQIRWLRNARTACVGPNC